MERRAEREKEVSVWGGKTREGTPSSTTAPFKSDKMIYFLIASIIEN